MTFLKIVQGFACFEINLNKKVFSIKLLRDLPAVIWTLKNEPTWLVSA
jgi:hypothetical protein